MQSRKNCREMKLFPTLAFAMFCTYWVSQCTHIFIYHYFIAEEHWPKPVQNPAKCWGARFIWCPADDGYFLPGWVIYLSGAVGMHGFLTLTGNFEKRGLQEYERKQHSLVNMHSREQKVYLQPFKCSLCLWWRSLNEIIYISCNIWLTPLISIIKRKRCGGEKGKGGEGKHV